MDRGSSISGSRAAEATALTHTGLVMGSPGFMSPEQAEGREVGPASDVFNLGAVLMFAATGDVPFGSGSTAALIYRVVHGTPNLEKVPDQVRSVVERCLAKDPGQRPAPDRLLAELGGADLTADWLPAPITRDFLEHPGFHAHLVLCDAASPGGSAVMRLPGLEPGLDL
jgi:eukaryotic-like serine/threonine-protein kinase